MPEGVLKLKEQKMTFFICMFFCEIWSGEKGMKFNYTWLELVYNNACIENKKLMLSTSQQKKEKEK